MHPAPHAVADSSPPHHPVLRTGVLVGIALCVLALAWLLVANRISFLERFAFERNLFAAATAGVFLLVPVGWHLRSPGRLFLSGLIAWTMLTLAYGAMEQRFPALEDRLGTFHLFVLGTVAYGLLATLVWVAQLVVAYMRQQAPAVRRRLP